MAHSDLPVRFDSDAPDMDDARQEERRLEELAEELYDALRGIAAGALRRAPAGLDPTDLVHKAWLLLSRKYDDMLRVEFLALCATIMRRLAVDEARKRARQRGGLERLTLAGFAGETTGNEVDLLLLDEALGRLRQADERWARIVELRFFAGMTGEEVSEALGLSRRTVTREWALARAWLKQALRE